MTQIPEAGWSQEAREREVRRQRAARRVARVAAAVFLWKRNRGVDIMLRAKFGNLVEADGHLFQTDPRDRVLAVLMRRRGYLSPPETWLYKRIARPGMVALDLGANFGYFTLLLARSVGPTGRVIAFEPDPVNFALLRRNVEASGYSNVDAVQAAVADADSELPLYLDAKNFGDHRIRTTRMDRPSVQVPVTRLDTYLPAGAHVDFIKMDIQGAEQAALGGGARLLRENPQIVIATEFWPDGIREYGGDPRAFLDGLVAQGFALSLIDRVGELPRPLAGSDALDRVLSSSKTIDLLCQRTALSLPVAGSR